MNEAYQTLIGPMRADQHTLTGPSQCRGSKRCNLCKGDAGGVPMFIHAKDALEVLYIQSSPTFSAHLASPFPVCENKIKHLSDNRFSDGMGCGSHQLRAHSPVRFRMEMLFVLFSLQEPQKKI